MSARPDGPPPRTRPKLLVGVVLAGVVAAAGIRLVGAGDPDERTAIELPARPATAEEAVTTVVPVATATTVPAATSTTAGGTATTVPGATLSTIPWEHGPDGTRREPFVLLPTGDLPSEPTDVTAAADVVGAAGDADVAPAASDGPTVPVPTAIATWVAPDDGFEDTTTTTVPAETTTTRSPTLGLVTRTGGGYWLFQADGSVYASRADSWYGDLRAVTLTSPVVGMQATATGAGYYLVSRDGGVFAFGDAPYDGSIPETLARQLESLLDDGYLAPTTTTAAKRR